MVITAWEEGVKLARELREKSMRKIPNYIKDEDLPKDLGHYVLDVPKQVLTPRELQITEGYDATGLLVELHAGKLTATEVTKAFLRRATLAQRLVNCVTEFLADEALQRAAELDEYFHKHGKPIGPLHGLPISVKDHIGMKGKTNSQGFTSMFDHIADQEADILIVLSQLGAIFHVRTTQPQAMMSIDTSSKLWGSTMTPWNRNLMAGGSSGGEGALVGMRGSLIGLGTDIGGSIRVPAACCGVWGFRESARRIPYDGINVTAMGAEQILCVVGPIAVSLRDCVLLLKSIEDAQPWKIDPYVLRMPWRDVPKRKDITIGVMWSDGIVQPHPPITRVLKDSVKKLEAAGIKVVEWKPYEHQRAWDIISNLYWSCNGIVDKQWMAASNEPWLPLTKWIRFENLFDKDRGISEICEVVVERDRYKKEYLKALNDAGIDFILCPAMIGASMPIQQSRSWAYTAQWNLLDYPAVVFPVGQVDQLLDKKDFKYKPMSDHDKFFYDLYDPKTFESAPVALQLVARTYEDEELAAAMEVVRQYLGLG